MSQSVGKLAGRFGFLATAMAVYVVAQFLASGNLVSGPVPQLGAPTLDGRPFDPAKLGGKPALIYFWASWCPICRSMEGSIRSLARDQSVFTVAMQSGGREEVTRYLEREGLQIPTILDEDGAVAARFGLRGVPAAFVVGPDGRIRFATAGYTSEWGLRARLWLASQ